jgi:hypothetical protein
MLTLETYIDEDAESITFCLNPTVPDFEEEEVEAVFGVAWTDGESYEAGSTALDGLVFYGAYDSSDWTWSVYDTIEDATETVEPPSGFLRSALT